MGRLEPRPAVIPVYAKERLQFLASVKIRIFRGNKSIILTFFTEGKEIIPFEDISGGICDESDGAEMVGDEVPDLEVGRRRGDGPVWIDVDVDDASSCRGRTLEDEGSGRGLEEPERSRIPVSLPFKGGPFQTIQGAFSVEDGHR